jgi:TATA-binding protein-associated factor Taf7
VDDEDEDDDDEEEEEDAEAKTGSDAARRSQNCIDEFLEMPTRSPLRLDWVRKAGRCGVGGVVVTWAC